MPASPTTNHLCHFVPLCYIKQSALLLLVYYLFQRRTEDDVLRIAGNGASFCPQRKGITYSYDVHSAKLLNSPHFYYRILTT